MVGMNQDADWRNCTELVTEDDANAETARIILAGVEQGPGGTWRMPWHAMSGGLPTNAFTGRPFKGQNILTLAAAARVNGYPSALWANARAWSRSGRIRDGETGTNILVPVFDDDGPTTRWSKNTHGIARRLGPIGNDAEGGEQRRFLGYRREPWFNVHQVDGVTIAPPAPPLPNEAAETTGAILAGWRGRGGPALAHGGLQAAWRPDVDRITMPPRDAFPDFNGLSGLEYYAATLAHEHVHATGSQGRLRRDTLKTYHSSRVSRAREELVAELGAAFFCGRYHLATALRPDHAQYVSNWLSVIGDRSRQKAFFWAVREAEKAVEFIIARSGAT
jgi:antirestriction protein ArdC